MVIISYYINFLRFLKATIERGTIIFMNSKIDLILDVGANVRRLISRTCHGEFVQVIVAQCYILVVFVNCFLLFLMLLSYFNALNLSKRSYYRAEKILRWKVVFIVLLTLLACTRFAFRQTTYDCRND